MLPAGFAYVEKGDPDSDLSAAATSCVTARESLSLSESPFSVREVGEDRVVSRIPSSYSVSNGLTPQQPPPGRGLWLTS